MAGALFAPMGTAQPIPASQLLSQCERLMVVGKFKTDGTISLPGNETAAAGCLGYLSAIHDLVDVVETGTGKPLLGVCMPKGVQVDQVAQIFINVRTRSDQNAGTKTHGRYCYPLFTRHFRAALGDYIIAANSQERMRNSDITPAPAAHTRSAGETRSAPPDDRASSRDSETDPPRARSSRAPAAAAAPAALCRSRRGRA